MNNTYLCRRARAHQKIWSGAAYGLCVPLMFALFAPVVVVWVHKASLLRQWKASLSVQAFVGKGCRQWRLMLTT